MPPKSAAARRKRREQEDLKHLLLVCGDAVVTAVWVLISCTFAEAAEALAGISGLGEFALAVAVTVIALAMMGPMCDMFGGALFNPVHNAAFVCAGKGSITLNIIRMTAQIVGALAGSYTAVAITPDWLKDRFHQLPGGLKDGVQLHIGVGVELALGLVLNTVVLYAMDTDNKKMAQWSPLIATVILIVTGSYFTGPIMNPAVAFSWFHHYQSHSWLEQIAVYWIAPFAGAMLGGLLYRSCSRGKVVHSTRQLPAELRAAAAATADKEN